MTNNFYPNYYPKPPSTKIGDDLFPARKEHTCAVTLAIKKETKKKKISREDNTVGHCYTRRSQGEIAEGLGSPSGTRLGCIGESPCPRRLDSSRGMVVEEGGGLGLGSGLGFGFTRRGDRSIPSRRPGCLGCGLAWKRRVGWYAEGRFCFRIGRRPFASLEEEVFRAGPLNLALASC